MTELSEPSPQNIFSLDKFARYSFLLLVFSLGFTQPYFYVFHKYVVPYSDLIFLATFLIWFLALIFKKPQFRWHAFYWILGFYFASMVLSTIFSIDPHASILKLPGEMYLLALCILTFNFVRTEKDAKQLVYAWLAATTVSVLVGVWSLLLFYVDPENWLLLYTRYTFGTLPPGNYLRLQSTFVNGNTFCNYLSVGIMLLLASFKLGWIDKKAFVLLFIGIAVCAAFTISPGLGGIALGLGLWVWLYNAAKRSLAAIAGLVFAVTVSVAFLFAVAISPNAQPDPQYYFDVPLIEKRIEPSARGLVWINAWKTFTQNPITGLGLGQDAADVHYHAISGETHHLKDAHNMFLNVAAQQGLFGLAAILLMCVYLTRKSFPTQADETNRGVLLAGLGIAFFSAFVYQGIGGSYEDTRFLWVLMGFILSTLEIPAS